MNMLRVAAIAVALAPYALAQRLVWRIDGVAAGDQLGRSVAGIGDMDHDGCDDLIVGAWQGGSVGAGQARVISGRTGTVLRYFAGDNLGDEFGRAVGAAGDFDGDGYVDVVIGAPGDDDAATDAGSVSVFSGRTGYLIVKFLPPTSGGAGAMFGYRVDGAGDLDGDGYDDILVGAPLFDTATLVDAGAAMAYGGRTRLILRQWTGTEAGEQLGHGLAIVGDLDGDLLDDVALGSPMWELGTTGDYGRMRAFSGRTGTLITEVRGATTSEYLGWSVGRADDIDGTLGSRVMVGGPQYDSSRRGRVTLAPAPSVVLYGRDLNSAFFGCAVAGTGDIDGDGYDDMIIGAYGDRTVAVNAGAAHVVSGRTRTALHIFDGANAEDWLGYSVDGAGDIDGDGATEVIIGVPFDDHAATDAGAALIYDFDVPGPTARTVRFGSPCAHANHFLPRVGWVGHPIVGRSFELRLRAGAWAAPVVLNLGTPIDLDLTGYGMPGCHLLANIDVISVVLTASTFGTATSGPIAIPDVPAAIGVQLAAQWIAVDTAANPLGFVLSDSVRLTIGG